MDTARHERRTHPRYKVKNGTLLYNETIFAEIINISRGGVYCKFITGVHDMMNPVSIIDLFNTEDKTCVQGIPCTDLNCHDPGAIRHLPMTAIRKNRLQFKTSDAVTLTELYRFIDSVITDPV